MQRFLLASFLAFSVISTSCTKTNVVTVEGEEQKIIDKAQVAEALGGAVTGPQKTPEQISTENEIVIKKHDLYRYPEITVELLVTDAQLAAKKVIAAGGKVIYDPNFGEGTAVPFVIATLPPEKVVDKDFISELAVVDMDVMESRGGFRIAQATQNDTFPIVRDLSVPINDIKVDKLRQRAPGKGLGENTIIAIVDTGVDASHPVFQDRVIYVADHTQETRTRLKEVAVSEGRIQFPEDLNIESITVPEILNSEEKVYMAQINEKSMGAQNSHDTKSDSGAEDPGLDINGNSRTDDVFLVLLGKDKNGATVAFVDTTGEGKISSRDLANPLSDFNETRSKVCRGEVMDTTKNTFLRFSARNRPISYPFIVERDENRNPVFLSLGLDNAGHGTHVAGIAAGNSETIKGAAPRANIMDLRVCSDISCTDAAIARALVDLFFNSESCIPDVVNISLGGSQPDREVVFDHIIRDLARKFGTTFVISAGNSGPGHRTINSLGAFSPSIMVGAHVSKEGLAKHYRGSNVALVADNYMFQFSSIGPSYSGHMLPHIAAPGSALSALPLRYATTAMWHGTSMAAPITSGAIAAMLSLAKNSPEMQKWIALRTARLKEVKGAKPVEQSLVSLPLAIRTSLQDTAQRIPQYLDTEQGYGLVSIDAAYDSFLQKLKIMEEQEARFFEVTINQNSIANALYSRDNDIAEFKDVQLAYRPDPEDSNSEGLLNLTSPLNAHLEKVEVQDENGVVTELKDRLPFSLFISGSSDKENRSESVVLGNNFGAMFRSRRHLDLIEPGKTYVARYTLSYKGLNISTFNDVVQRPVELSDLTKRFDPSSANSGTLNLKKAHMRRKVNIRAGMVHRYNIPVSLADNSIDLRFGINPDIQGILNIKVFDPKGQSIFTQRVTNLPNLPVGNDGFPNAFRVALKNHLPGVYEVVVSNEQTARMSNSQYDLLVNTISGRSNVGDIVRIATKSAATPQVPEKQVVSIPLDGKTVPPVFELNGLDYVESLPVQLVPTRWTFRRINPPSALLGEGQAKGSILARLRFADGARGVQSNNFRSFLGRIDHRLYTPNEDGKSFKVAYVGKADNEDYSLTVKNVNLKDPRSLYVAVEVIDYRSEVKDGEIIPDEPHISVRYSGPRIEGADKTKLEMLDIGKKNGVMLLEVQAPDAFPQLPTSRPPKVRAVGLIEPVNPHPAIPSAPEWPDDIMLEIAQ